VKGRYLYILPALMFAVFAVLQYNDPDAFFWMGIYTFIALANVLAMLDKLNYAVVGVGFAALLFLITSTFQSIEEWSFDSEEGREIFGLILGCNWMGLLGILKLYKDSSK